MRTATLSVERNSLECYGYDLDDRLAWVAFGLVESPTLRVDYLYDAWGNQVGRAVTEHGVTVERHLMDGLKVAQDLWGAMPQRWQLAHQRQRPQRTDRELADEPHHAAPMRASAINKPPSIPVDLSRSVQ